MSDEPAMTVTDATPRKRYGIAWGDEIDETRKQELWARLRAWWDEADHGGRKGPFASTEDVSDEYLYVPQVLTGAEVFWLAVCALAQRERISESRAEERFRTMFEGPLDLSLLELQGANLRNADLRRAGLTGANLQGATLIGAQLQEADMSQALLQQVDFRESQMRGAIFFEAHLEQANLRKAHLEKAVFRRAELIGTNLREAQLAGANLREAFLNEATTLRDATLSTPEVGNVHVVDVRWGAVNLATLNGTWLPPLGDEQMALQGRFQPLTARKGRPFPSRADYLRRRREQQAESLKVYREAVRANRQVAVVLQNQGINEEAGQFAYHAQLMQRTVYRLEGLRSLGRWLFSWFLWLIAGYGYRPGRSVVVYLASVALFAVGYFVLGVTVGPHLSPYEAAVVSLTAFHGRGFFAKAFQPGDPQAGLAALEAVFGLLIEISFIATFTQRFFGAK